MSSRSDASFSMRSGQAQRATGSAKRQREEAEGSRSVNASEIDVKVRQLRSQSDTESDESDKEVPSQALMADPETIAGGVQEAVAKSSPNHRIVLSLPEFPLTLPNTNFPRLRALASRKPVLEMRCNRQKRCYEFFHTPAGNPALPKAEENLVATITALDMGKRYRDKLGALLYLTKAIDERGPRISVQFRLGLDDSGDIVITVDVGLLRGIFEDFNTPAVNINPDERPVLIEQLLLFQMLRIIEPLPWALGRGTAAPELEAEIVQASVGRAQMSRIKIENMEDARAVDPASAPDANACQSFYRLIGKYERLLKKGLREEQQPPGMSERLMRFQLRALAHILDQERASIGADRRPVDPGVRVLVSSSSDAFTITMHPLVKQMDDQVFAGPAMFINLCTAQVYLKPPQAPRFAVSGSALCLEMGLGKTPIMLAAILANRCQAFKPGDEDEDGKLLGNTLILCPAILMHQWRIEVAKHTPSLSQRLLLVEPNTCVENVEDLCKPEIVLVSLEAVRRQTGANQKLFEQLVEIHWWRLVADEAQQVGTTMNVLVKRCTELTADHRNVMTGTPVNTSLSDIFGILVFMQHNPFAFGDWFKDIYLAPCLQEMSSSRRLGANLGNAGNQQSNGDELQLQCHRAAQSNSQFTPMMRLAGFVASFMHREPAESCWKEVNLLPSTEMEVKIVPAPLEKLEYEKQDSILRQMIEERKYPEFTPAICTRIRKLRELSSHGTASQLMSRLATSECPPPQLNEVHATRTYTSRGLAERAAQLAAKESSLAELDCQLAGVSVSANAKFRTDDRLARSIVSKAEKSILKFAGIILHDVKLRLEAAAASGSGLGSAQVLNSSLQLDSNYDAAALNLLSGIAQAFAPFSPSNDLDSQVQLALDAAASEARAFVDQVAQATANGVVLPRGPLASALDSFGVRVPAVGGVSLQSIGASPETLLAAAKRLNDGASLLCNASVAAVLSSSTQEKISDPFIIWLENAALNLAGIIDNLSNWIGCSALAKPGKKKKKKTAAVEEEEKASEDVDAEPVDVARRKARRARSSSRPFEDAPLPRHELADCADLLLGACELLLDVLAAVDYRSTELDSVRKHINRCKKLAFEKGFQRSHGIESFDLPSISLALLARGAIDLLANGEFDYESRLPSFVFPDSWAPVLKTKGVLAHFATLLPDDPISSVLRLCSIMYTSFDISGSAHTGRDEAARASQRLYASALKRLFEREKQNVKLHYTPDQHEWLESAAERAEARAVDLKSKMNAWSQQEGPHAHAHACNKCKEPLDSGFLVPCSHVYCRPCYLSLSNGARFSCRGSDCPTHGQIRTGTACTCTCTSFSVSSVERFTIISTSAEPEPEPVPNRGQRPVRAQSQPQPQATAAAASSSAKGKAPISASKQPQAAAGQVNVGASSDPARQQFEAVATTYGSKIAAVCRELASIAERGEKCVVFAEFEETLKRLIEACASLRPPIRCAQAYCGVLHERSAEIARFQGESGVTVCALLTKVGACGLTLTAANNLFFLEPCMNLALVDQASRRIVRVGQTKPTVIKHFYVEGTLEEAYMDIMKRKRESFRGSGPGSNAGAPGSSSSKPAAGAPSFTFGPAHTGATSTVISYEELFAHVAWKHKEEFEKKQSAQEKSRAEARSAQAVAAMATTPPKRVQAPAPTPAAAPATSTSTSTAAAELQAPATVAQPTKKGRRKQK